LECRYQYGIISIARCSQWHEKYRNQKEDILGFNNMGTTEYSPPRMDSAKQDKALIHFLTAERPEGLINYELLSHEQQCRRAKQLTSAS